MRYLLDTHILIWALFDPTKLSEKVKQILSNPINMICVSSVDFWEISIKFRTGKKYVWVIIYQAIYLKFANKLVLN